MPSLATAEPSSAFSYRVTRCCDGSPGVSRERGRGGFRYRRDGKIVRDPTTLARIAALAIPPAWEDVWICPTATGHLQATGRDARGRKQYRYHPKFRADREAAKFGRLAGFGLALPRIRRRVAADLKRPGLPRDKVLAAVVRLLDRTHLRVGNDEYVRANGSFGLSTLLDRHVHFGGGGVVSVRFRGKSGVWHEREVADPVLAAVVEACRDLPGPVLFQYAEGGACGRVRSADVNDYIRRAAAEAYTAKDFRTWAGTVGAAARLSVLPAPGTRTAAARAVAGVVREVAADLGNTPAVCRGSYIHPAVLRAFEGGTLPHPGRRAGLSADEGRALRAVRP